jgi:hypothetical protein
VGVSRRERVKSKSARNHHNNLDAEG